jgi:DNA-binding transcriptional LysR family regulator
MKRDELNDLAAFALVAELTSFTQAATRLGMSASALSHAMKSLESRLGMRLLARTTRSVRATEAGERLLRTLRPALDDIQAGLGALSELREKPSGTLRITTLRQAANSVLLPLIPDFLADYPEIGLELIIDEGLSDIVADRYDAGIRHGHKLDKDMIAVRISADIKIAVVASPSYLAKRAIPKHPRELAEHHCINYRYTTSGGTYLWQFEEDGRPFQMRVEGHLAFNDGDMILASALAGQGIAYVFEEMVTDHVAKGRLTRMLEHWCPTLPGYYLYHPSRRQTPPALSAMIEALRTRLARAESQRGATMPPLRKTRQKANR